jgi:methylenetetrahydrofolate dehydrogenase (NADP+)/methenyltetrahydrofolate cyclohydrolase
MATIIDGKALSASLREGIGKAAADFSARFDRAPGLAAVLVGDDPASKIYVGGKEKACAKAGIFSLRRDLPGETSEADLLGIVAELNRDDRIDGILVQLPLPDHIDEARIIDAIDPSKDVDGFHPVSVGNLMLGKPRVLPCTPLGMMLMLDHHGVDLKGKEAVVVGRSNIVGKPMAILLLSRHATVTLCHSRTADLAEHCRRADVLVAAVGRPRMIQGDWVREGAVVLDVGINRIEVDGKKKLVGDVDYEPAAERASLITPVPGGVGPMTITSLLLNTVQSARASVGEPPLSHEAITT